MILFIISQKLIDLGTIEIERIANRDDVCEKKGRTMKFSITPELAKLIKTLRVQSGVSAKDLAERIGKSRSYVSKLESGSIRSIDRDALTRVLCVAADDDDLYGGVLPAAVKLLRSTMEPQRMVDQMWLMEYDVIERTVSVPAPMSDDIRRTLDQAHISAARLVAFANANIDSQTPLSTPANELVIEGDRGKSRLLARIQISEDEVNRLMEGGATTSYFMLYVIVHALFRLRLYPSVETKLPPDDAARVLRCVASYMDRWDIHSLVGFSHFLSSDEFIAYQTPLAGAAPDVFDRIASQLREVASYDSANALTRLNAFDETLSWDPAFALKVMGLPFSHLGDMSFANKRALLAEIEEAVNRYTRMDDIERKMESY